MSGPNRICRTTKWIGTIISALILVAWLLTIPLFGKARLSITWATASNSRWNLGFAGLRWVRFPASALLIQPGLKIDWLAWTPPVSRGWGGHGFRPPSWQSRMFSSFDLPLWMPFLIIATLTIFLWFRARRRHPPGHCGSCGYNLTSNESGRCPECGNAVSTA